MVFCSLRVLLCVVLRSLILPGGANESAWQFVFNGAYTLERTKGVYLKETMQNMCNDLERSKKPGG